MKMRSIHKTLAACGAALSILGYSGAATAEQLLFGATHPDGSDNASLLVTLDPITGAVVDTIGFIGYGVTGLAWDATTHTLYGSTSHKDPTYNGLIEIDWRTGAGTEVNATTAWGMGAGKEVPINNIAIDSSGQMYGQIPGMGDTDLVEIDKATGTYTTTGPMGIVVSGDGLAFDSSDTLFLINGDQDCDDGVDVPTYTVDTATGVATAYGDIAAAEFDPTYGYCAHHSVIDPGTDIFYGLSDSSASSTRAIYTIDMSEPTSIDITDVLPTNNALHTLAFGDNCDQNGDGTYAWRDGLAYFRNSRNLLETVEFMRSCR